MLNTTSYSTCVDESGPNTISLAFCAQEEPLEIIMKGGGGGAGRGEDLIKMFQNMKRQKDGNGFLG